MGFYMIGVDERWGRILGIRETLSQKWQTPYFQQKLKSIRVLARLGNVALASSSFGGVKAPLSTRFRI